MRSEAIRKLRAFEYDCSPAALGGIRDEALQVTASCNLHGPKGMAGSRRGCRYCRRSCDGVRGLP